MQNKLGHHEKELFWLTFFFRKKHYKTHNKTGRSFYAQILQVILLMYIATVWICFLQNKRRHHKNYRMLNTSFSRQPFHELNQTGLLFLIHSTLWNIVFVLNHILIFFSSELNNRYMSSLRFPEGSSSFAFR